MVSGVPGKHETRAVHSLQAVPEHRPIDLVENVDSDMYSRLRIDAQNVCVVRAVMDLAESQSVGDYRLASRVTIRKNVGSIEQFYVAESTDRAAVPIGAEHYPPKLLLVQALHYGSRYVFSPHGSSCSVRRERIGLELIGHQRELQPAWVIACHINRHHRIVHARIHADEIQQR